jgi:hypothetical protein
MARRRRILIISVVAVLVAVAVAVPLALFLGDDDESTEAQPTTTPKPAGARVALPSLARNGGFFGGSTQNSGNLSVKANRPNVDLVEEGSVKSMLDVMQAQYKLRAYPLERVSDRNAATARAAFTALPLALPATASATGKVDKIAGSWKQLGNAKYNGLPDPFTVNQTKGYTVSGRITALVIGSKCVPGNCRMWVGAGGGGVFRTDDALAAVPKWKSTVKGLTSSAIGSLILDPTDESGKTLYAGTGELGGSDSEAGTGVFRSTDGGNTWTLLPGSATFAKNRGVTGIAIDPRKADTIYVATARSGHGTSSVFGGKSEPPGVKPNGVYMTTDGGDTFTKIFSQPVPGALTPSTTRSITQIGLDPNDPDSLYIAVIGAGLFRRSPSLDNDTKIRQVFVTMNTSPESYDRLQFAFANREGKTRMYLGDSDPLTKIGDQSGIAHLWRVDDLAVPAATLLGAGGTNSGWKQLSSTTAANPGFESYRYCAEQCWYDDVVASPPGQPDTVYLGGMFHYGEAGSDRISNGRAVIRSQDGGVRFTDLSAEAATPSVVLHPDIHAIAFSPDDPEIAFIGSDGGVYRTSGKYADVSAQCADRVAEITATKRCQRLLSKVPTRIYSLNQGLSTLQFQSISVSPANGEILAGAQDNGTWHYTPAQGWIQTAGGDGGQSGTHLKNSKIKFHTWYNQSIRVNFRNGDDKQWAWIAVPLYQSGEATSWYMPFIVDPKVPDSIFVGLEHVWRSKDNGGPQALLENECTGGRATVACGDWKALGPKLTGLDFGSDRFGEFIAAIERAPSDSKTLWAATLPGRIFITKNVDVAPGAVKFKRIDLRSTGAKKGTPGRFVSGIVVDTKNPNHAWISFSGYNAHTPLDLPGHVFEVTYNPSTGKAAWKDLSFNLGDEPITDVSRDAVTGDIYAATDFGVVRLPKGATAWTEAAPGLPIAAVYGLTLSRDGKTLYAATHGRSAWSLRLG